VVSGIIAGVLDTDEAIAAARYLADRLSTSLCNPAAFELFAGDPITEAQDILDDGTNASGVPCNAISIGIGFTAKLVANPTQVAVDPTPLPDPCDAGVDAQLDASSD
jgi:hypothetical protein